MSKQDKTETLDFINYHIDKLMELAKMGPAIEELGEIGNKYTRVQLAIQIKSRIQDMASSAYMLKHYIEELNQSVEGTIDDFPVSEEVTA